MAVKKLQFTTVPVRETIIDDPIFKGNLLNKVPLYNDEYFSRPILTVHIYHNIPRRLFYATHKSGTRSVIEYNKELTHLDEGIYIIYREDMGKSPRLFTNSYLHYLSQLPEGYIKNRLYENVANKNDHTKYDQILRDITFIPLADIEHFNYIVDHRSSVMVSIDDEPHMYPSDVKMDTSITPNKFNIAIYRAEPEIYKYYINVVGTVIPIQVLTSCGSECAILSYKENSISKHSTIPIDDFADNGIYKTREEALHHGDLASGMMLERYKHELDMASISRDSLYADIESKLTLSKLSIEDRRIALDIVRTKLDTEYVKRDSVVTKSDYENLSNKVKSASVFGDILNTGAKVLRSIL